MTSLSFHDDVTARLDAAVSDLASLQFLSLTDDELEGLLATCTSTIDRINHATARVACAADERQLGDRIGAKRTAHWLARITRMTPRESARRIDRATHLAQPLHAPVADALADGALRTEQADVIIAAVNALPSDLEPAVVEKARDHLLDLAGSHDADELRTLGKRILDVIDPERADDEERKRLEAEEERANATARLTMTNDGHGKIHGKFAIPELYGELLRSCLMSLADPRRDTSDDDDSDDEGTQKPERRDGPLITAEKLGHAFMEFIEAFPADKLPSHASSSVALTVTIDINQLIKGLGVATLSNGKPISVSEARRLACRAGILPAVLGGRGEVLDLGRARRLFSGSQFKALAIRDKGCAAEGCTMPSSICHAHHDDPWSRGGVTDLDNGRLLCPHHHRLVHNPRFESSRLDSGKLRIVRRT